MKKVVSISSVLVLVALASAGAQKNPMRKVLPKWWEHPRVREKLQLDDAQVQQLNDIHYRYQSQLIDLRSEVEKSRLELERAMAAENWNENEIMKLARASMEARNRVELKQLEMMLQMRKVLTPEQWKELHRLREEIRTRMGERFRKRMGNRGRGPAPPPPERPPQPPPGPGFPDAQ